ncbi:hypothetical protein FA95DRAFT_1614268 [Auriscalpium vulgare]|uniref:Uncharacterized protein n=1 Tax=Auriscalpium vulgare TaxID=40419 RepID=A0ACB8R0H0_9AGAM|nr:hypothetical protein FA95DRAFT_1614268 [Auriscalpium vulgare]
MDLPQATSATISYPFALHHALPLPWSVLVKDNSIILRSNDCSATSSSPNHEHAPSVAATRTQSRDVQSDAQAEQLSEGQQVDNAPSADSLIVTIQDAVQAEPTLAALAAVADSRAGSGRRTRTASRRKQDEEFL